MNKKLFKQIAATELLSNKELLQLLTLDKLTVKVLFDKYPDKAIEVIKHPSFVNYTDDVNAITYIDDQYPEILRQIYNPPALLYCIGDTALLKSDCLGIIGARKASNYSSKIINRYCGILNKRICIVSGMAKGADSMAHIAALNNNLATIAVMGTGIKDCYPKSNEVLKSKIAKKGLIISEYPPNHQTKPYNFVQRNRIIAGLSQKLIITEAKKRSGSLITASLALENGREVWALPGRIDSDLSRGTNELIRDGAMPLLM